jgi:hypothetical protein
VKHIVMFSGGICSWAAAKRVAERHGTADMVLLFADTKIEDEDTYRFLREAAANVGVPLTVVADGRTPWEVFRDVKFLGNSRADPCSRVLKREVLDAWMDANCSVDTDIRYVGIHWSEMDRYERVKARLAPWDVQAPMCESPFMGIQEMHRWAEREGLRQQRLYTYGMPHANCGGGCVKAGQGHFALLLEKAPARFAEWEANEQTLRDQLGDVSILTDRSGGGGKRVLTLRQLRERIEAQGDYDQYDFGGCGCFTGDLDKAA